MEADNHVFKVNEPNSKRFTKERLFKMSRSRSQSNLLNSVGQDDEADEDTYCPVQVPDVRFMFEDLSADEDGESHDSSNQRIKT